MWETVVVTVVITVVVLVGLLPLFVIARLAFDDDCNCKGGQRWSPPLMTKAEDDPDGPIDDPLA